MWRVEVPCAVGREEMELAWFLNFEIAAADTDTGVAKAWFASRAEAERCASELGGQLHEEGARNWNEAWQADWSATAVGERLWLAPPWDANPAPEGRIRLDMHPGGLFGNGDHPTTLLCLEELERLIHAGDTVLDVGCGSGLLQQAALLLGARAAFGCDLDFAAAATAPDAFQGSADAVASGSVDIVVANIPIGVLERILPELSRVSRRHMILSGMLEDQVLHGLPGPTQGRVREGWRCLTVSSPNRATRFGS